MTDFFAFVFGAVIGSFLNVIILRYNTGESVVKTGSRCFSCGQGLKWFELIPILSFLMQKGKCRNCKSKISWQYPLVELTTGVVFLLIFHVTHYALLVMGYWLLIACLLIIIAVYDIRHQIIPNLFVYLFVCLTFLNLFRISNFEFRIYDFFTGLGFFAVFGLIWLLSKGTWMGLGDAKLVLGIGWLLGLNRGITALLFSFWAGALAGILLLLLFREKYNIKSRISFGPFLVFGTFAAMFFKFLN